MSHRRPHARTIRSIATAAGGVLAVGLALAPAASSGAAAGEADDRGRPGPTRAQIALPDGFQPEGIATGTGRLRGIAFLGSRADGDIYRADLRTGRGRVIAQGPGTPSLGMKVDRRGRLFVAGGTGGDARVIDTRSGRTLATYQLTRPDTSFVNDVVLTKGAAFFTDSENAQLFKLALRGNGPLPRQATRVPLRGEWRQQPDLNANGITTTPDGRFLLVVNSATGELFRVPRGTGRATRVDLRGLGGAGIANGDGLLREGRTLYAVQNRLNRVAVLRLARDGRSARLDRFVSSPRFDVPTTIARSGGGLYLPNARFSTPPTPTTRYSVVRVGVPRG